MPRRHIAPVAFVLALIVAGFFGAGALGEPQTPRLISSAALPWLVLAAGLGLAALAGALGLRAARRGRAQQELDRIFTLSRDLITVADFDGRFSRVNPAVEQVLGYTPEEFLARPYLDFVHPDDRDRTAREADAISRGKTTVTFTNRYIGKDGAPRTLEWTAAPVVEDGVMYGVARDVTARRQAETDMRRLAEEQAALRRVATLVARGTGPDAVFSAVADEAGALLGCHVAAVVRFEADGTVTILGSRNTWRSAGTRLHPDPSYLIARVRATGSAARFDTDDPTAEGMPEAVRAEGIRSALASPIVVDGELWGSMTVGTSSAALGPDTEARLGHFTDLIATAVANTESRARADQLGDAQAALRRVATLVAKDAPPREVFAKVAEEVAELLDADASLWRNEAGDTATVVAVTDDTFSVGARLPVDGDGVIATVLREGRPCWVRDDGTRSGAIVARARDAGIQSDGAIGAPILVGGRVWGALAARRIKAAGFSSGADARLMQFADLVATAIANADARAEIERLADEQAALGRVATLVAQGVQPAELFAAVSREVGRLFRSDMAAVTRFDPAAPATIVVGLAQRLEGVALGSRWEHVDGMSTAEVHRTGRSARTGLDWPATNAQIAVTARNLSAVSSVSSPIVVEGRLWGTMTVAANDVLPLGTEERLEKFTELVAIAIANVESREALRELADEQAALRRVATLVAEGSPPTDVFDAVADEMAQLLQADDVALSRYEPGGDITLVAHRGPLATRLLAGSPASYDADDLMKLVRRTGRAGRIEHGEDASCTIAAAAGETRVRVSVGAPIVVEGRLWGVMSARWQSEEPPPVDTEDRMARFAQLLDTAIANADSRDQLTASRARLVTEADAARRRVVRDLHDGAQQRLVHTIVSIKLATRALHGGEKDADQLMADALDHAERSNRELRELAHGILPSVLTNDGLRAGVDAVVERLDLPVSVDIPVGRFPADIEASAYFIVAEALTNVVKHADAASAEVTASVDAGMLRLRIRDDGVGGADRDGHGLVGMYDRVTALGGRLEIDSPPGGGTALTATLPIPAT